MNLHNQVRKFCILDEMEVLRSLCLQQFVDVLSEKEVRDDVKQVWSVSTLQDIMQCIRHSFLFQYRTGLVSSFSTSFMRLLAGFARGRLAVRWRRILAP